MAVFVDVNAAILFF